jgi:hypothetical protein
MKKLWQVLEVTQVIIAAIGIPLFIISLITCIICDFAGFKETILFEISDGLGSFIINYVMPVWVFLYVFIGLHAVDFLIKKHKGE